MDCETCINQFELDYQFCLDPKSVELYLLSVKQLIEHSGKSIDTLNKKHIRLWLYYLSEKGYKPQTISSKLGGLKTFFTYCCEEGILSTNPAVGISIKMEESKPFYLSLTDLTKLRQLVNKRILAERAIIEVLYATGMRISELSNMRREDIYWNERTIQIQKGKRKKGRIVLFTKECEVHLKAYLDTRMDDVPYVFVSPKYADRPIQIYYVGKRFREIYSKQLGFRVTPHTLRHTFAAHLAQKGMPLEYIQTLLGHESPQQTRYYARLYNHARKELYDEFM
ncbi:tyrosine-type recombinase/integrase [Gottfriedia solisilvae]|uniref:Tyrosine recombinase XerC n=1 Tax=Gottfriedia solisilvae TaxID=1516104 RepID=A0A8J3F157_9BACI|nr:tyrosine-type recombinase/integrase [Gottfriedia solisilvae]GGI16594.1 tyrosine recombinase XerC [Gottfriedia solisilvae]